MAASRVTSTDTLAALSPTRSTSDEAIQSLRASPSLSLAMTPHKAKGPANMPAPVSGREVQPSSVLRDNRSTPVELVVHADQRLLNRQAGRDHVRRCAGNEEGSGGRARDEADILAPEVHVVVFAEHRPAGCEHPFEAAANGPAEAVDAVGAFQQEGSSQGGNDVVILICPSGAALDVAKQLLREQVTDAAGRGDGGIQPVVRGDRADREERERRRDA